MNKIYLLIILFNSSVYRNTIDCNCPLPNGQIQLVANTPLFVKPNGWHSVISISDEKVVSISVGQVIQVNKNIGRVIIRDKSSKIYEYVNLDTISLSPFQMIFKGEQIGTIKSKKKLLLRIKENGKYFDLMNKYCVNKP